ncbi:MAG: M15 family metallopeptidase [Ignavibacteriota bacterium]
MITKNPVYSSPLTIYWGFRLPYSVFIVLCLFLRCSPIYPQPRIDTSVLSSNPDLVNIAAFPNVKLNKRYASINNFCGIILDPDKFSCQLHPIAAEKFRKACDILAQEKRGWKFIVFDAFRPLSVQQKLYQHVKGTPMAHYVAYPSYGIHCYGFAIDLSIIDESGKELDMGTEFDNFTQLAEPRYEMKNLHDRKLTKSQYENRMLLRSIMKRAGFHQLQREWWHYEALPEHIIRRRYKQRN